MHYNKKERLTLIFSVFIAGLCSIIYELLISTTSSYFLGNTVKQFSLTIGFYMAALGIGSYFSRLVKNNLLDFFILLELFLSFIGGLSVVILYFSYVYTDFFEIWMFFLIIFIGFLIGFEIPILIRIMQKSDNIRINVSNILTLDYIGALIATLAFPLFMLPFIGLFKTSLIFGLINMFMGFLNLYIFQKYIKSYKIKFYWMSYILLFMSLSLITFISDDILKYWRTKIFKDPIVFVKRSVYQDIVITKKKDDIRLFLNGHIQFSSKDEHRYHESLVHPAFGLKNNYSKVLVFGGGDGMTVREILKYKNIKFIKLVDLDPEIIQIANTNPYISKLNAYSLKNKKVDIVNQDALIFLKQNKIKYDVIIADLPDPSKISIARLYTKEFYNLVYKNLTSEGKFITHATSSYYALETFWCIYRTIKKSNFKNILPYHVYIPSFGDWGFVMASDDVLFSNDFNIKVNTRFMDRLSFINAKFFQKDLLSNSKFYITLDNPILLTMQYNKDWLKWN